MHQISRSVHEIRGHAILAQLGKNGVSPNFIRLCPSATGDGQEKGRGQTGNAGLAPSSGPSRPFLSFKRYHVCDGVGQADRLFVVVEVNKLVLPVAHAQLVHVLKLTEAMAGGHALLKVVVVH